MANNVDKPLLGGEMDVLPIVPVVRRSVVEEVVRQLAALIESGQLQVNDRFPSEVELSHRFEVSRTIVREALGRLKALGLTEARPGIGTYVASNVARLSKLLGQYSAEDLYEVRSILEVPAARLAARRRTAADIEQLRVVLEAEVVATNVDQRSPVDTDFHCLVARATGNMLFVRLVEDLREVLHAQTVAMSELSDRNASVVREHTAVLEAIVRADGEEAARAMSEHLDAVEAAVLVGRPLEAGGAVPRLA